MFSAGLSGGWIVQHLLMRGEDPKAIRIVDLVPNARPSVVAAGVAFHKTDISDPKSVAAAFDAPWPSSVKSLPLTVFHTVAMINPADRKPRFLGPLIKVNVDGTRNILNQAKKSGASCFVATSSGSVGAGVPDYFPLPWKQGKDVYQFRDNADPPVSLDAPPEAFPICYTWTKAQAEKIVREATSDECPTGIIRPTNGVYGTGVEQSSSLTWEYLHRGGGPTWLYEVVGPFVCSQNVSIGHLALEKALLDKKPGVAGSAYAVTDPNPPIHYGDLYLALSSLAHPSTPVKFPKVPFIPIYLISLLVEQYSILRHAYLPSLPPLTGDLKYMQPGVFKVCTTHMVFPDTRAQKEIGYRAAYSTMDGIVDCVLDWNRKVEAKARKGKEDEVSIFLYRFS